MKRSLERGTKLASRERPAVPLAELAPLVAEWRNYDLLKPTLLPLGARAHVFIMQYNSEKQTEIKYLLRARTTGGAFHFSRSLVNEAGT